MAQITVVTPATNTRLLTVERAKRHLGITASTDDTFLRELIAEISVDLREIAGQAWTREIVDESLVGTGDQTIMVDRTPINAITSITVDGGVLATTDYSVRNPGAGIIYRKAGWPLPGGVLRHPLSRDPVIGSGDANIVVRYDGGYTLPSFTGDTTPDLPGRVTRAALLLLGARWSGTDPRERGVKSEKIGDYAATYGGSVMDDVAAVLEIRAV